MNKSRILKNTFNYFTSDDIRKYIRANESVVEEVNPRSDIRKFMDYFSYLRMFIGRYWPLAANVDGIRRIINEDTNVGLVELVAGLSKIAWDLYTFRTRYTMIELANKYQQSKQLPDSIDSIIGQNLKS